MIDDITENYPISCPNPNSLSTLHIIWNELHSNPLLPELVTSIDSLTCVKQLFLREKGFWENERADMLIFPTWLAKPICGSAK